jgi:hypothetical protein
MFLYVFCLYCFLPFFLLSFTVPRARHKQPKCPPDEAGPRSKTMTADTAASQQQVLDLSHQMGGRWHVLVKSSARRDSFPIARGESSFLLHLFPQSTFRRTHHRSQFINSAFLRQEPEVSTSFRSVYHTPRVTCLKLQDSLILRNPRNKQRNKLAR